MNLMCQSDVQVAFLLLQSRGIKNAYKCSFDKCGDKVVICKAGTNLIYFDSARFSVDNHINDSIIRKILLY